MIGDGIRTRTPSGTALALADAQNQALPGEIQVCLRQAYQQG